MLDFRTSSYYQGRDIAYSLSDIEIPKDILNYEYDGLPGVTVTSIETADNPEGYVSYKANKDFLANNPEWACAFNSAMNKAVRFINDPSNDDRTIQIATETLTYETELFGDTNLEAKIIGIQLDRYRPLHRN